MRGHFSSRQPDWEVPNYRVKVGNGPSQHRCFLKEVGNIKHFDRSSLILNLVDVSSHSQDALRNVLLNATGPDGSTMARDIRSTLQSSYNTIHPRALCDNGMLHMSHHLGGIDGETTRRKVSEGCAEASQTSTILGWPCKRYSTTTELFCSSISLRDS